MARFLKANTATIVTVGPFYDKTDGVTIEGSLTITNERITMVVDNNDGSAPTIVLDNVTGATSGTDNDLNYITGMDAGMMQIELSAANTNHAGKRVLLSITDAANHVPVFHEFQILPAAVFDTFAGTDAFPADIDTIKGQTVTCGAGVTVLASVGTAATSTAQTGDTYALANGASGFVAIKNQTAAIEADTGTDGVVLPQAQADKVWSTAARVLTANTNLNDPTAAAIADAVWDEAATGHTDAGKAGAQLWTNIDAILADTGELQTNQGAWATATGFSTHSAADVWGATNATLSLTYAVITSRLYRFLLNKMNITDATGSVALRNEADDGNLATQTITDDDTTTTRTALSWV